MRPHSFLLGSLMVSLAGLLPAMARGGEQHHYEDAALHAVQFVDKNEGWTVGDEGVIWHTIDGGRNWERQPSGIIASLRSVCFLNPYVGWVAGRTELPGGGSSGVLLLTKDGGLSWEQVLLNALPGLNVVRFVDDKIGYLAGDGSDQHPSGVFLTESGGLKWSPIPGPRCPSWLGGGIAEAGNAVLAGAWNRLATAQPKKVVTADSDFLGGRNLRGVHFLGKRGVAVGQGGLVLLCDSAVGTEWHPVQPSLSAEIQSNWDFHAVHGNGTHFWIVGRPGSVVLHSSNSGQSWDAQRTRQPLPLNGVFFIDDKTGWAVGELGSILGTTDGGRNWKLQQRGGQRLAALFLHARPGGATLETVADLGAREGYLTGAVRVTSPDGATANPLLAAEGARFSAAARLAGGAAGEMLWQFPLGSHLTHSPKEKLLESWDQLNGEQSGEQLIRQIVLAFRIWQPSVVVTDYPDDKATGFPADTLLVDAVRTAYERAGDQRSFPEQINVLGLEPWQVAKVYSRTEDPKTANVLVDLTPVCPALEASVQEYAAVAVNLLDPKASVPCQRLFRHLAGQEGTVNHKNLMQGVQLEYGGLARRAMILEPKLTEKQIKAMRMRANLKAISEAPGGLAHPERLLAQLGPMLADMPDEPAGRSAFAAAMQLARIGQWNLAREAFLLMVDQYPLHPLSAEAYRWLLRHNSSSEARRRHEMGQFMVITEQVFGQVQPRAQAVPPAAPDNDKAPGMRIELPQIDTKLQQASYQMGVIYDRHGKDNEARRWYQSCLDLETKLAAYGPLFSKDPAMQFCLQSARRNMGDFETPRKWYAEFVSKQPEGPWRRAAMAELWLLNRTGPPPKEVASCRLVETRPHLDGKLDDACWQQIQPIKLVDAGPKTDQSDRMDATGKPADTSSKLVSDYPTDVKLGFDREFLYVAIRCFHPAGEAKQPLRPRLHNADMRDQDRVSLMFDLDRDYATCFHLQVDQRGCVLEDCWGDRTWNPHWFVGQHNEARCWTVELAIPLNVLTGDTLAPGRVWAFNAIRVLPGRGVQAWSLPAEAPEEAMRPEGLGLLLFTSGQGQTGPGPESAVRMPKVR
jgi:photosystem II stability/assembly factor-like uncharacterized protein